jgi:CBS domain-containing protein
MRVQDAMSATVVTLSPAETLREAARMMLERRVGAALVVDEMLPGPGILTERDIMRAVARGADLDSATVQDTMTFEARTSGADWDLEQAGAAMIDGHFRHLIVVADHGGIVGIVSMRDIVRAQVRLARAAEPAGRRMGDTTTEITGSAAKPVPATARTR